MNMLKINITNGTVTQISETLIPDSGYVLPSSIEVSGASSTYNSSSGLVGLTNLTNNISLSAEGSPDTPVIDIKRTKLFLTDSSGNILKLPNGKFLFKSLPDSYQEVEYIESTGTQRIKTDILPKSNYKIEEIFAITDKSVTSTLWCARGSGTSTQTITAFNIANGYIRCDYNSSQSQTNVSPTVNQKYKLTMDANKFYIDDVLKATHAAATFTAGNKIELFASYTGDLDSNLANYSKMKLYSFKVWDENDKVKGWFIPCYRKSDDVIGLYDLVNNKFYTNNGTGTFIAGTSMIPDEYQKVEYISTNTTVGQYIDTEYIPSYSNGFEIYCKFQPMTSGTRYGLLSNYNEGSAQLSLELNASNKARFWMNNGSKDVLSSNSFTITNPSEAIFKYSNGTYSINLNGTVTTGSYTVSGASTTSLFMFLDRMKRTTTFTKQLRIYSCKIKQGNELLRNFVPCYRKSDNVIGMYDTETQEFYINKGTGTFIKGNNIN